MHTVTTCAVSLRTRILCKTSILTSFMGFGSQNIPPSATHTCTVNVQSHTFMSGFQREQKPQSEWWSTTKRSIDLNGEIVSKEKLALWIMKETWKVWSWKEHPEVVLGLGQHPTPLENRQETSLSCQLIMRITLFCISALIRPSYTTRTLSQSFLETLISANFKVALRTK